MKEDEHAKDMLKAFDIRRRTEIKDGLNTRQERTKTSGVGHDG